MPDHVGLLGQGDAGCLCGRVEGVEQAQLDLGGVLGEQREVDAGPVPGRAERVGLARPDAHGGQSIISYARGSRLEAGD